MVGVEGTNFGLLQRTRSGQPWGEQSIDKGLEKGRSLGVQGTKGCPRGSSSAGGRGVGRGRVGQSGLNMTAGEEGAQSNFTWETRERN